MTALQSTITAVLDVVRKHCTPYQIDAILDDLGKVPGNASFKATIAGLRQAYIEHTDSGGPGWQRMRARLGPEGMEALRQKTLREQREGLQKPPEPKRKKQPNKEK